MYLVIAGGGEVGSDLAKSLHTEHDVVIIDHSPSAAERLANYDVRVVVGNATDPEILREAGVEMADAFIAATSIDEVNLISSLLAKGLGAREALCFVGRADYAEVLTDPRTMDILGTRIDRVLWPQRSLAQEILEIILIPKALDTEELAGGRLRLIEYLVEEGGPYAHRYLGDLEWPEGTLLLGVVRKGEFLSAREPDFAELVLEPGDLRSYPRFLPHPSRLLRRHRAGTEDHDRRRRSGGIHGRTGARAHGGRAHPHRDGQKARCLAFRASQPDAGAGGRWDRP